MGNEEVARLYSNLIQKETCVNTFAHKVERLKQSSQKLSRANENLLFTKHEIIALPIKLDCQRKNGKNKQVSDERP